MVATGDLVVVSTTLIAFLGAPGFRTGHAGRQSRRFAGLVCDGGGSDDSQLLYAPKQEQRKPSKG